MKNNCRVGYRLLYVVTVTLFAGSVTPLRTIINNQISKVPVSIWGLHRLLVNKLR